MRPHDGNANYSRNHHHQHQEPEAPPEEPPMFVRQQLVDVQSTEEFPTLGNAPPPLCPVNSRSKPRNLTIRGTMRQGNYNENFPALGPESLQQTQTPTSNAKTLNFSVTSSSSSQPTITSVRRPTGTPNLSIHVNHR